MKKLIYLMLVPLLVLSGSCKKFLDQQPLTDLSSEKFWLTGNDARIGMAGIYDELQATSNSFFEWGDARSDNFMPGGSGGLEQINLGLNSLTPSLPSSSWTNLYRTIARVNVAIKYLPNIKDLSEKDRNHYLAQCYAIRALMYFYAIRVWGDVPLWLEPYEDIAIPADLPRTAVADVFTNAILPDITKAATLADPTNTVLYELNLGGILALQSEIYLWRKDYANVITASDKLIALNRYALAAKADWKKIFTAPGTTKENIFNIFWDPIRDTQGQYTGDRTTQLIGAANFDASFAVDNTPGDESPVHLRFQNWATQGDIRAELTYDKRLIASNTRKTGKYVEQNLPYPQVVQFAYPQLNSATLRFPVYRYADILLMRAEAFNQLNSKALAITALMQTKIRAGLTAALTVTATSTTRDIETAILDERQIELFGEGKRWFDLVRTGRVLEVMDSEIRKREVRRAQVPTGFTDARKILWPISRAALIANRKLVQNPPWSE